MTLETLLIAILVAAVVYWLAGLLLPYPIPAILAVLVLILALFGHLALPVF